MRGWPDHEGFGFSECWQACGEVRRLADDIPLFCLAGPDEFSNDYQASGDTDANLESFGCFQVPDRLDLSQAGAHRSRGITLVNLRISEIDQHPVAHVSGDEATVLADSIGNAFTVSADYFPQISGSSREASAVERTRSQNIMVSWRRWMVTGR